MVINKQNHKYMQETQRNKDPREDAQLFVICPVWMQAIAINIANAKLVCTSLFSKHDIKPAPPNPIPATKNPKIVHAPILLLDADVVEIDAAEEILVNCLSLKKVWDIPIRRIAEIDVPIRKK